jgi:Leucine-rich repeat (LRR) protein
LAKLTGIGELDFIAPGWLSLNKKTPPNLPFLPWVKILQIKGPASSSLAFLHYFPNLEGFSVQGKGGSITVLPPLPSSLRYLNLSGACIPSLKSLPPLPKLQRLDVSGCPLTSLEGLPRTVRELYL